jgi:pimeloyl-ACP methyl ester carboxylesterase
MPTDAVPFVREAGNPGAPGVVCLHANASSSAQWRELLEQLSPDFHALAPDAYGAGKSPDWPSDRVITLGDEVSFIAPVLARAGATSSWPPVLVGHSYGAAVALIAALQHPGRVRALALYEPTLFSLIDAHALPTSDADGIRDAVARAADALDQGDADTAARHFIDYWMGEGAWANTPSARKPPITASMRNVRRWAHALTTDPTPLAAFRSLDIPVLYMVGGQSPASSLAVAQRLIRTLPRVEVVRFESLGHMAPVTQAAEVNAAIASFLARVGQGGSGA